ncbi:hypothetical protein [Candidatus Nitronereus thalassa]|uniref:Uncharacterized protein n=1 Tax=Candidatus Nitronereus thalassa TaxID=3020898 RepID=A0ABU3K987_9BACT|nr:hypothetical protein [Candidatus Nitronereus thalassa]MDT7042853.1 hypothetical protein [Candidatus Nitronereus thalassa]
MTTKPDDLEAVRNIVNSLSGFEPKDQERILRWSREKLGLPTGATENKPLTPPNQPQPPVHPPTVPSHGSGVDIKSFVNEKDPKSNQEFTATIAYYYRFEAPETSRKETITAEDLQEACRLAGRARFQRPAQTLINAHQAGLIDKSGDRGGYAISTVGENLVAMTLPSDGKKSRTPKPSPRKKPTSKKSSKIGKSKKPKGKKKT